LRNKDLSKIRKRLSDDFASGTIKSCMIMMNVGLLVIVAPDESFPPLDQIVADKEQRTEDECNDCTNDDIGFDESYQQPNDRFFDEIFDSHFLILPSSIPKSQQPSL
jgi:hypothetical protein